MSLTRGVFTVTWTMYGAICSFGQWSDKSTLKRTKRLEKLDDLDRGRNGMKSEHVYLRFCENIPKPQSKYQMPAHWVPMGNWVGWADNKAAFPFESVWIHRYKTESTRFHWTSYTTIKKGRAIMRSTKKHQSESQRVRDPQKGLRQR